MSLAVHSFMIVAYLVAAAVAAFALPTLAPQLAAGPPLAMGAGALAVFAIVHASVVALIHRAAVAREVKTLRKSHGEVMRELAYARAEVVHIHDALEAARGSNAGPALREVAGEVETLRREIERLHGGAQIARARPEGEDETLLAGERGGSDDEPDLDDARVLDIVREAIDTDRVDLYLQPIVSLPQRKHRFHECFSRVRDEAGTVIGPEQYLAIAEREGLIAAVDNILLIRCIQLVRKTQQRRRDVGFFVNISAHTLADTKFFREFIRFMGENEELAPYIIFEFVQEDVTELPPDTAAQLQELGAMGFRFSLDQVKRLDLNYRELSRRYYRYLKIDCATLLAHLKEAGGDQSIEEFKTVLDGFAIDLIVERIEDEGALVELLDFGIDYGQGYLFGEPRLAR